MTGEKTNHDETTSTGGREKLKFLAGGILILGAIAYLIFSGTATSARYFITVEDLVNNPEHVGETVRVSGAVLGDSIEYSMEAGENGETSRIAFTMANIPDEIDDLAKVLHESVSDPNAARVDVVVMNQPMPDLLQHEAQAIVTGTLDENGVFHANELLLKCPSRYEESVPDQGIASEDDEEL